MNSSREPDEAFVLPDWLLNLNTRSLRLTWTVDSEPSWAIK